MTGDTPQDIAKQDIVNGSPDALEFAALVCSRVCHDVISPVGAIVNGLEILDEEDDKEMRAHALTLIAKSADQASAKLQFARLAFGAFGSAGAEIETDDARQATEALLAGGRTTLVWDIQPAAMHKTRLKLLMNLVQFATGAIPRGGELKIIVDAGNGGMRVVASGVRARIPEYSDTACGTAPSGLPDSRAVQPYLISLLCKAVQASLSVSQETEDAPVTFAVSYAPGAEMTSGMIG